jgi:hypothetical protein
MKLSVRIEVAPTTSGLARFANDPTQLGDPQMLLFSMTRFFKFLSEDQRQAFLGGLIEKAS